MSPEFVNCDICGKTRVKILFAGEDMHFKLPGKFNLCECQRCGLVCLNPRPTKSEMLKYYPERDYGAWQPLSRKPVWSILIPISKGHFDPYGAVTFNQ